jgi:hypothetical protein
MRRALAAAVLALALAASASARADDPPPPDPRAAADALFHQAEAEDTAGDYAHAVEHYRAAVRVLPSFRFAPKAITRATLLESHSEGEFGPYKRLEAVRRDPKTNADPAAIDALASDAAGFPAGPTRGEAWMLCAEAYLSRLHRRGDGEVALRHVIDDPQADALLKREAADQLIRALIADGDLDGARETSQAIARWLDPKVARSVTVARRRQWLRRVSTVDLAAFLALALLAVGRAVKGGQTAGVLRALRVGAGLGLVFAAYLAAVGGVLASSYETGNAAPFLFLGVLVLPIALIARAWGAAGSTSRLARSVRSLVCASAVVAAAFLLLEALNPLYLEGFHL